MFGWKIFVRKVSSGGSRGYVFGSRMSTSKRPPSRLIHAPYGALDLRVPAE